MSEQEKLRLFRVNRMPAAYVAFAVEIACIATAAHFSWIAAIVVVVAIFTQTAWQIYLEEKMKEQS